MLSLTRTLLLASMAMGVVIAQDASSSSSSTSTTDSSSSSSTSATDSSLSSSTASQQTDSGSSAGVSSQATSTTSTPEPLAPMTPSPISVFDPAITMFFPGLHQSGLAVSVVSADPCTQILALACPTGIAAVDCSIPNGRQLTGGTLIVTQGPDFYAITTSTNVYGTPASGVFSCNFHGTTMATCYAPLTGFNGGSGTTISVPTTVLFGLALTSLSTTLPITANARALSSTLGICSVTHNTAMPTAASGTPSQGSAPKAIIKTVYKVVVVPAAAVVLAGVVAA